MKYPPGSFMGSDAAPEAPALPASQAPDITRPSTPMDAEAAATREYLDRIEGKPVLVRPRRSFAQVLAQVRQEAGT